MIARKEASASFFACVLNRKKRADVPTSSICEIVAATLCEIRSHTFVNYSDLVATHEVGAHPAASLLVTSVSDRIVSLTPSVCHSIQLLLQRMLYSWKRFQSELKRCLSMKLMIIVPVLCSTSIRFIDVLCCQSVLITCCAVRC